MKQKITSPIFAIVLIFIIVSVACTYPGFSAENALPEASPEACSTCEPCLECEVEAAVATQLAQLETPVIDQQSTATPQETPTPTLTPEATPTSLPTNTAIPTAVPAVFEYSMQEGSPAYLPNLHHLDLGSSWMGVGGQVFGSNGEPLRMIVVRVRGMVDGQPIDLVSMTGTASQYGQGGFEIKLADRGVNTANTVSITLFDLAGKQISPEYMFSTYAQEDQLLAIINFTAQ